MVQKRYIWIFLIVCLAFILRFWQLARMPPALNSDEVAIGYNAYSILKTGRDEYGQHFPLTFRSFDDYKMPVYIYLVAASLKIFGYNDFAVRFPSALFGTLTVLYTFLLIKELIKEKKDTLAIFSSFLLAVSPWSVMFSRSGYEANVAVFFAVTGLYYLFRGMREGWMIVLSAVLLALSVWTYLSARIFIPFLLIGIAFLFRKELLTKRKYVLIGLCLGIILLFPIIRMSLSARGQMRAQGVSVFGNPDDLQRSLSWTAIDQKTGNSFATLFHNRRIDYLQTYIKGYLYYFDPIFLFMDLSMKKYRAPGMGLLYLFELPLLCLGLYYLFRKNRKTSVFIIWWMLVAPVAAAFTKLPPNPVRSLTFIPVFQIVAGAGLNFLFEVIRKKKFIVRSSLTFGIACVIAFNMLYFFHQYYVHLPIDNADDWYVGRREMVTKLLSYEKKYKKIFISNTLDFPYIFFLYYAKTDPAMYLKQGGTVSGGFKEEHNRIGPFEFRTLSISQRGALHENLFVGMPKEVFNQSLVVDRIYYPDRSPSIVFFE